MRHAGKPQAAQRPLRANLAVLRDLQRDSLDPMHARHLRDAPSVSAVHQNQQLARRAGSPKRSPIR